MESTHGNLENMRSRTEATISQLTDEKRMFEEKVGCKYLTVFLLQTIMPCYFISS